MASPEPRVSNTESRVSVSGGRRLVSDFFAVPPRIRAERMSEGGGPILGCVDDVVGAAAVRWVESGSVPDALAISWSAHDVSPLTPRPPTRVCPLYNASPPPKTMVPPQTLPTPVSAEPGVARHSGTIGLPAPAPQSECPGWLSV